MIDEPRTREMLRRIVHRMTADAALRDDLMQEALVHLWLLEEKRPGQTTSWYLQSCKFHLQNYIAIGRSVDSPKRRSGKVFLGRDGDEAFEMDGKTQGESSMLALVSARDIISLLIGHLTSFERAILGYLAEGFGAREIAGKMKVSHPTVIKHRRKIAAHAIRLGIAPPLPCRPRAGIAVKSSRTGAAR